MVLEQLENLTDYCKEESNFYENSEVYAAKDVSGSIIGSIRILKWNYTDELPLQQIFGINPLLAINNPNANNIYHIGRFAVKKEVNKIHLLQKLMVIGAVSIDTQL